MTTDKFPIQFDFDFLLDSVVRPGTCLLIGHLPSQDAIEVCRSLFTGHWSKFLPENDGCTIGLFTNRENGATFGCGGTGLRYAIPRHSGDGHDIIRFVDEWRNQGRNVRAVVIDDECLKRDCDNELTWSRLIDLRSWAAGQNIFLVIFATLTPQAEYLKKAVGDDWIDQVQGRGYYSLIPSMDTIADVEFIVDIQTSKGRLTKWRTRYL